MKDDYAIGEDDPIWLDDVAMAAHLCRTARGRSRREHIAYRNRLIQRCHDQGDVTRRQLAQAAELSLPSIDAIRRAAKKPAPRPRLRIVR